MFSSYSPLDWWPSTLCLIMWNEKYHFHMHGLTQLGLTWDRLHFQILLFLLCCGCKGTHHIGPYCCPGTELGGHARFLCFITVKQEQLVISLLMLCRASATFLQWSVWAIVYEPHWSQKLLLNRVLPPHCQHGWYLAVTPYLSLIALSS